MSADLEVLTAMILQHTECNAYRCAGKSTKVSAEKAAQAILRAGFQTKDKDLEARIERLERWMKGDFS